MKKLRVGALAAMFVGSVLIATALAAESSVEVKGVHICCGGCVKAAQKAVSEAGGTAKVDAKAGTVAISAANGEALQKALNALGAAGFHGETGNKDLKIADLNKSIPDGKVSRLEVDVVHNCCGKCVKGLKGALAKVDGVSSDTIKAKAASFVIEGNFSAADVVKQLRAAGYEPKVSK